MWVKRFIALALLALFVGSCGGKSVRTLGGEAGAGSACEDTLCDGECVDTSSDELNCGACENRCRGGSRCVNGECRAGAGCEPPNTLCNGECVDVRFSQEHCGACNYSCGFDSSCNGGVCSSSCPSGQCGNRCVDFNNDPSNCGGCNYTCGRSQYCDSGRCLDACNAFICNGQCVDIYSDPNNCGDCGIVCRGPGATCIGGGCQSFCPEGTLLCGDTCVDYRIDPENCGGCNLRCAGDQLCRDATCVGFCPTGTFCNGVCVDFLSDPNNCGTCFNVCVGSQRCSNGMCVGTTGCGNGIVDMFEEADPPPVPLGSVVPINMATCRYDFSRINQWYCNGSCGNWGGPIECDQGDADAFCRLKMDNPRSVAVTFSITNAAPEPGVCCPPPSFPPNSLGCTSIGTLSSRGVNLNVSVHPTNLFSTHQGGKVITNLVCTNP